MSYKAEVIWDQTYFTKKTKIFSGNGGQFVFETLFSNLSGQKLKIGCFYEFIPGFPKRLSRISLNIENGVTIMWSVKSVGLKNLLFLKFRKKISQLRCPGKQCGQLSRSLKIRVEIKVKNSKVAQTGFIYKLLTKIENFSIENWEFSISLPFW